MFSERAKTIALAIVKIFETSKPFGDYSAVAVLDDGAGISYGTSQFTHKSGSLWAVLQRYGKLGGRLPEIVLEAMPDFEDGSGILRRSNNKTLKQALAALGRDPLMQRAQREIAFENYLEPALAACDGSNFTCPLSLAVIYDSMNHGSWGKIRDRVKIKQPGNGSMPAEAFEREWITAYVKERHEWLNSIARLKKTAYRTKFFSDQIKRQNWNLVLPLSVHGFELTEKILFPVSAAAPQKPGDRPDSTATKADDEIASSENAANTTAADLEGLLDDGDAGPVIPSPPPGGEFTGGAAIVGGASVHVDNVDNMNVPGPRHIPLPQDHPITLRKERSSVWAKIGAIFAALMGLGINLGNILHTKLNEMTLQQLGYALGGVAIVAAGLWVYDRSAQRAHEKTQAKMQLAADTEKNTIELKG